jgi:hypothetical protein
VLCVHATERSGAALSEGFFVGSLHIVFAFACTAILAAQVAWIHEEVFHIRRLVGQFFCMFEGSVLGNT